jgi:hypothetical protein
LTHTICMVSAGVFETRCLSTTTSPSWLPTRCSRWRQAMRPSAGERRLAPRPSLPPRPPRTYFEIIALHSLQSCYITNFTPAPPNRPLTCQCTQSAHCSRMHTHIQYIVLLTARDDRHLYLWQHSSLSLSHTHVYRALYINSCYT